MSSQARVVSKRARMNWMLAVALAVVAPAPALALIDMNGMFWVERTNVPDTLCTATFTQTGSALSVTGCIVGSGTIDTATGAILLPGAALCGDLAGSATNDGADFTLQPTGTGHPLCFIVISGSRHCHDGTVGAGEQCDPGPVADRCCRNCAFSAAGAACPNEGNVCTQDVCDGAGTCTHP